MSHYGGGEEEDSDGERDERSVHFYLLERKGIL